MVEPGSWWLTQALPWRKVAAQALFLSIVSAWYTCSFIYSARVKYWYKGKDFGSAVWPVLLLSSLVSWVTPWCLESCKCQKREKVPRATVIEVLWSDWRTAAAASLAGAIGNSSQIAILFYGSIGLTQVVRAVAPAFNVVWLLLLYNELPPKPQLACFAVSIFGTALACLHEPSFKIQTLVAAILMNLALTLRNVLTKRLMQKSPSISGELGVALLGLANATAFALCSFCWLMDQILHQREAKGTILGSGGVEVAMISLYAVAYNLASQLCLSQVPVLFHGVIELGKRIFVILIALLLVRNDWIWVNYMGATIAVSSIGVYAYYFKSKGTTESKPDESSSGKAVEAIPLIVEAAGYAKAGATESSAPAKPHGLVASGPTVFVVAFLAVSMFDMQHYAQHKTPLHFSLAPNISAIEMSYANVLPFRNGTAAWFAALGGPNTSSAPSCASQTSPQFVVDGVYYGAAPDDHSPGEDLSAEAFPYLLADVLSGLTQQPTTVNIAHSHIEATKLDSVCVTDVRNSSCAFAVLGSVAALERALPPHAPLYFFGAGVHSSGDFPLRLPAGLSDVALGGLCGPLTAAAFRAKNVTLPVLLDPGLLAGRHQAHGSHARRLAQAGDGLQAGGTVARRLQLSSQGPEQQPSNEILLKGGMRLPDRLAEGRSLLVVGLRTVTLRHGEKAAEPSSSATRALALFLRELALSYQVVLQPGNHHQAQWQEKLQREANQKLPGNATAVEVHASHDHGAVMRLCRRAHLALHMSSRLGLACAAVGTPSVYLSQDLRVMDLMAGMGTPELALSPLAVDFMGPEDEAQRVVAAVNAAAARRGEYALLIQKVQEEALRGHSQAMQELLARLPALGGARCCSKGAVVSRTALAPGKLAGLRVACAA